MSPKGVLLGVSITALTALLYMNAASCRAEESFTGRVYDIDYLGVQGWTQVLIQGTGSAPGLVGTTSTEHVQRILEAALITGDQVNVTYWPGQPAEIRSAELRTSPASTCIQTGCVGAVSCSAVTSKCSAKIQGQPGEAYTYSVRAVGILLSALIKRKPVEYLTLDTASVITRVKINVP